jgi:hypothetical protein
VSPEETEKNSQNPKRGEKTRMTPKHREEMAAKGPAGPSPSILLISPRAGPGLKLGGHKLASLKGRPEGEKAHAPENRPQKGNCKQLKVKAHMRTRPSLSHAPAHASKEKSKFTCWIKALGLGSAFSSVG